MSTGALPNLFWGVRSTGNPFPGLRPFGPSDAHLFFGRERHVEALLAKLAERRLVAVVGTSGSGKSSLVLAGALPRLERGYSTGGRTWWRIAYMRPGNDPFWGLAGALLAAVEDDEEDDFEEPSNPGGPTSGIRYGVNGEGSNIDALERDLLYTRLTRSPNGLVDAVANIRLGPDENLLLVVDQFEELFRFHRLMKGKTHDSAAAFVNLLLEASEQHKRPIYVMLTMRSDFLGECVQFPDLAERINDGQYLVPLLNRDQRAEAICGPVGVAGASISPALVQHLLNDAGEARDQLPVLQHALMRTFDLAAQYATPNRPPKLELSHYRAIGQMTGSLSSHANDAYEEVRAALGPEGERVTQKLFRCLTGRSEHGRGVRRPCKVSEVLAVADTDLTTLQRVVCEFVDKGRRFLVLQPPGLLSPDTTLDISHESLMRKWELLGLWFREELAFARQLRSLDEARKSYEAQRHGSLRDPELSVALQWRALQRPTAAAAARYGVDANAVNAFLDESRKKEGRRNLVTWGSVGSAVLLLVVVGVLLLQRHRLNLEGVRENRSRYNQEVALVAAKTLSLVSLARESKDDPGRASALLREVVQNTLDLPTAWHQSAAVVSAKPMSWKLRGHSAPILTASFSPNGQRLVTTSSEEVARLWDPTTASTRITLAHENPINSAVFSPDGRRVATASDDSQVLIWDASNGEPIGALHGHDDAVSTAEFSPNGEYLVTASRDKTMRVWRTSDGKQLFRYTFGEPVVMAAYSPDGKSVVAVTKGGAATLWTDVGDGKPGRELYAIGAGRAVSARFSADGKLVVTACADGAARVWNVRRGALVSTLKRNPKPLTVAAFNVSGKRILTGSQDGVAVVWEVGPARRLATLVGHSGSISQALFADNDGSLLLTSSADGTSRIWSVATGQTLTTLSGHTMGVTTGTFDAKRGFWFSASEDGSARIWDVNRYLKGAGRIGHGAAVLHAEFSREHDRVVTGSEDGTARVWFASSGAGETVLSAHDGPIRYATFSNDGNWVITIAAHGTARLWPSDGSARGFKLARGTDEVVAAAFSPDDSRIATASNDGRVCLWDRAAKRRVGPCLRHGGRVNAVAFAATRPLLVAASFDRTAVLWDVATGKRVRALEKHTDKVYSVEFSPDGSRVITASADGSARIWNTETGYELRSLTGHSTAVLRASFSSDGQFVVTTAADGTARLWDGREDEWTGRTIDGHHAPIVAAAFSPDAKRVITASEDKTAKIWSTSNGELLQTLLAHTDAVTAVDFSADGQFIVTASRDFTAALWSDSPLPERFLGLGNASSRIVNVDAPDPQARAQWYDSSLPGWRDARTAMWRRVPFCFGAKEREQLLLEEPEFAKRAAALCLQTVDYCQQSSFDDCRSYVDERYAPPKL